MAFRNPDSELEESAIERTLRRGRLAGRTLGITGSFALLLGGSLASPEVVMAQVRETSDGERDGIGDPISNPGGPDEGWSARAGIGFTANPTTFLMNLEAQYAFDDWIAVGPMLQLGLDDHYAIVAPTLNVTFKYADLPGRDFDRLVPYTFGGMGFAVIDDDRARNDKTSTGFMIDLGAGVEYQLTDNLFLGTQVMFDFLPQQTQGQKFIFAWQIGGLRYAF